MSSITMAADSTQSEQKVKKKQSKRKKHRSYSTTSSSSSDDSQDFLITKKLKKKASKESKMNSSDSNRESDLDLSKELLTISGYVDDKEAMIENMFKSISSKKMKTMLPEILQPLSSNELKALCLEQLHVMSSKRISKILAGDDPETISSSASEEGEMEADERSFNKRGDGKIKTILSKQEEVIEKTKVIGQGQVVQDSSKAVNKDGNRGEQPSNSPNDFPFNRNSGQNVDDHRTIRLTTKLGGKEFKVSGTTCREKIDDAKKSEASSNNTKFDPGNNVFTNTEDDAMAMAINCEQKRRILIEETQKSKKVGEASKSQLEILELEMRARAIKAMLKAQDEHDKQPKRKSCEAESRESRFDERKQSRVEQNERSEKGTTPQRSHAYSFDKRSYDRSHGSSSFEGRSNYWEKHPDEDHTEKHWENRGHKREPDRHDDRRYNEWRDRYRDW